jgi:hypothetical protein
MRRAAPVEVHLAFAPGQLDHPATVHVRGDEISPEVEQVAFTAFRSRTRKARRATVETDEIECARPLTQIESRRDARRRHPIPRSRKSGGAAGFRVVAVTEQFYLDPGFVPPLMNQREVGAKPFSKKPRAANLEFQGISLANVLPSSGQREQNRSPGRVAPTAAFSTDPHSQPLQGSRERSQRPAFHAPGPGA